MEAPILVIGALGHVGSATVDALVARGAAVRAAGTRPERLLERFGPAVEAVRFDFADPETYGAAFAGVERMFLMRPPQLANIERDLRPALDAALAAGVRRVSFLSLIGIEKLPYVPHAKVEAYLRASGQDWTFLRASFFMQNLEDALLRDIREKEEIAAPVGYAKTSFIDARDVGVVAAATLLEDGHSMQAYDLTGSEALDYFEVASLLSAALGREIRYTNPSALAFFARQLRAKEPLLYALVTTWLYTNTKRGMAASVTSEVQRLLGRAPTTLANYIEDRRPIWQR